VEPPDPPVVNPDIQPVELTKEEVMELAIAHSELEELGGWHGLPT
jgi:hypothetical protein